VPPPPQAEGRNIFSPARVLKRLLPGLTFKGLDSSPLIIILTSPWATSFYCAYIKPKAMTSKRTENAMIAQKTNIKSIKKTMFRIIVIII